MTVSSPSYQDLIMDIINNALNDPVYAAILLLQVLIGIGLGYFTVKAAKYIIVVLGLIGASLALNAWALGRSPESSVVMVEDVAVKLRDIAVPVARMVGLMTLGPLTTGFIIGVIIALVKS